VLTTDGKRWGNSQMTDQLKQIASRLKELREVSGVTAESLAIELEIPLETYKEYESGNCDIPVSLLYEIANKFNVELTAILTGENPRLHTYALVRKGKGASVERRKSYSYQSLAYNFVRKRAEPMLVTVEPKSPDAVTELNAHPGQEFDYVLEGSLKVVVGESELVLNEGDSIYFDSHCPHSMAALNGKQARFLAVIL
jgi:transcriptional regulator with XRE-family HTH domain